MTSVEPQPQPTGVIAAATRIADDLVKTLPPAFLLLVMLNIAFLGMVMWFINSQQEARNGLLNRVVDKCMEIALQAQPTK